MEANAIWNIVAKLQYFYYAVISFNVIVGAIYYTRMDTPLKLFFLFLVVMYLNEIVCLFFIEKHNVISAVSHVYSIFELALISIYFFYTVLEKPQKLLVIATFITSALIGVADLAIQKIDTYNSYMLVIECLIICPQALYVLYKFSDSEDILKFSEYPHFYVWRSLLVLWSVTFFYWTFRHYLKGTNRFPMIVLYYTLFNVLVYIPIGYAFLKLRAKSAPLPANSSKY